MLNAGNQKQNFISSSGSGFFNKLRFRFHYSKSYGSYGSDSTTLVMCRASSACAAGSAWCHTSAGQAVGPAHHPDFLNMALHGPQRITHQVSQESKSVAWFCVCRCMIMIFQGRLRMMQGEESAESRIWLKFSTFLLMNKFHQICSRGAFCTRNVLIRSRIHG